MLQDGGDNQLPKSDRSLSESDRECLATSCFPPDDLRDCLQIESCLPT